MLKALHPTTAAAAATTESFILVPVMQELSKWRTQAPTGKMSSYTHVMHAGTVVARTAKTIVLCCLQHRPCIDPITNSIVAQYTYSIRVSERTEQVAKRTRNSL
jgi:hypothetical protein